MTAGPPPLTAHPTARRVQGEWDLRHGCYMGWGQGHTWSVEVSLQPGTPVEFKVSLLALLSLTSDPQILLNQCLLSSFCLESALAH